MWLRATDVDLAPVSPAGIPRFIETPLACIGLLLVLPLLGVVALAVRLSSAGPVVFRQLRVGRHGVDFALLKFRTMRVGEAGLQITAKDDRRITPLGRWLRKLKLDELPSLWNVVRGDMSLVGPRPEVPRFVDKEDSMWRRALSVRPGLTDPVTLWLRNEEELMESVPGDRERFYLEQLQRCKLAGYLEYLERRSILTDFSVILQTVLMVVMPALSPAPSLREIQERAEDTKAVSHR